MRLITVLFLCALIFVPIGLQAQTTVTIEVDMVYAPSHGGDVPIKHFVLRHTVQPGETLNELGQRFLPEGADPTLIQRRHANPNQIDIGETITIVVAPWEMFLWERGDQLFWKGLLPQGKMSEFNQVIRDEDLYWQRFRDAYQYKQVMSQ